MRSYPILFIVLVLASSCSKEEPAAPLPMVPAPATCGSDGARLTATFDGTGWCANVNLFASLAAGEVTINGITTMGSTLTLQLDSIMPGTYEMTEAANSILFTTSLGFGYMSRNEDPAQLVITSHDLTGRHIKGTFSGNVYTPLSPEGKSISGSFDMHYPE